MQITCKYFNGSGAQPHDVMVNLYSDSLSITNTNQTDNKEIFYSFEHCRYVKLEEQVFIYLSPSYSEYIVIPLQDPASLSLLSKISAGQTGWFQKLYRKNGMVLLLAVVLVSAAVLWTGYKIIPPLLIRIIPVKEEVKWGNQLFDYFASDLKTDTTATRLMETLTHDFVMSDRYPIQVTVVKDTTVNAFALPGGHIVIYSGIIAAMKNQDELYALLGHEASHVNERHSLQGMTQNLTSSFLLSLISSDFNGLGTDLLAQADFLRGLSYSRKLEASADWKGQEMMIKNKINPGGMTGLMEALQKSHPESGNWSFLSTHPITSERISESKRFVQLHPSSFPTSMHADSAWIELKKLYPGK
ncbi:MAG: M48 family metallopeptidase [Sediminibacterium sp.]|nr:M48 family metallopeptidase [Sediminibacterium sp.]